MPKTDTWKLLVDVDILPPTTLYCQVCVIDDICNGGVIGDIYTGIKDGRVQLSIDVHVSLVPVFTLLFEYIPN